MSVLSQFLSYSSVVLSIIGNTAGAPAAVSTGTLFLAGGPNITLSQAGQSVTISGGAGGGGSFSGGVSNLGNTLGSTGITGSQLVLAGGNNITLSQSTGPNGATVTISAQSQSAQPASNFSGGVSNLGNTSGSTGISGSQLVLAGGNNVTLSQSTGPNGATVTISAFTQSAQPSSAFSGGLSNIGNTLGSTGLQSSQLVLAGGNNITLSGSTAAGGLATVTISAAAQTVESQTAGISNLGNTSGTSGVASGAQVRLILAGGNNVTLSQSINGASATITVSAANQTVESQTAGISNLGNTSGTSGVASGAQVRLILAGGNNVTLSQSLNGASATITIAAASQTSQSNTLGMSNLGNTNGTSGVISGPGLQLLLAGGANITLSQSINGASATITISGGAGGAGGSFSAGVSTGGNTLGSTGITGTRLVFAGGNNITLSQATDANGGTITVSAFNQSAAPSSAFSAGISTGGNTLGSTGLQSSQLILVGGNNITLSGSTAAGGLATVTISGPNTNAQLSVGLSTLGNTSGDTGLVTGQLVLAGGANITLSGSTNAGSMTISISGNAGAGGGGGTIDALELLTPMANNLGGTSALFALGQSTLAMYPLIVPQFLTASYFTQAILYSQPNPASTTNYSGTISLFVGLYSRNGSTLSLASSGSNTVAWTNQSTNNSSLLYGTRYLSTPITISATPGRYYVGIISASTTGGATFNGSLSNLGAFDIQNLGMTRLSGLFGASTNASNQQMPTGWGTWSAQTAGLPASVAFSDLRALNPRSIAVPYAGFANFSY